MTTVNVSQEEKRLSIILYWVDISSHGEYIGSHGEYRSRFPISAREQTVITFHWQKYCLSYIDS